MKFEAFTHRWFVTHALGAITGGLTLFLLAAWDPETTVLAQGGIAMAICGAVVGLAAMAIRTIGDAPGDR